MEAGRSFTMLFPISQSQIALPRPQQALGKQDKMRKKEVQLQNQLQRICQRQRDAHRRNQDLLRDFKRIEQELSLLTAKSDSFRRKQEKYKKQIYLLISEQSKHSTPSGTTSTLGHSYMKQFHQFHPAANYGHLYEPCHFPASVGHVGQPLTHFHMSADQQAGLQGCCNQSLRCGLLHPHCDGEYGSFIPEVCKMLDSTLDYQSHKKLCHTSDTPIPRNVKFIPKTKRDIIQHCPGSVYDKESSSQCKAMPTHFHGDSLHCTLSSDMYRDWKEELSKEVQGQMAGEPANNTTVEQSTEEDSRRMQACQVGSTMAFSEFSQISTGDHNIGDCSKPSNQRKKNKQLKTVFKNTPYEVTAEQNKEDSLCKEQTTSKAFCNEIKLSLNMSNVPDSLVGIGVNEQTSSYKRVENDGTDTVSEAESEHEEAKGHLDPQCLHKHEKDKGTHFLDTLLKSSVKECIDSSEEESVIPKESESVHIVQKKNDKHSQKEATSSSCVSVEEKESTDSSSSIQDKRLEIEGQGLFTEMVQHSQSICAGNSCVINEDKLKEIMSMSEQDSEPSDKNESQMQEIKCDDGYTGMPKGDIYGIVGESERFREMLTAEIEQSSNEEDQESQEETEAEDSVHEKVCIFTVKEKDTQRKVSIDEESETEDTREDRTCREDGISMNDSQGISIVVMDAVIHGNTKEEQSDTEADKEILTKKENQTTCNTENNITSEEEMSVQADTSDEDSLSSEDLDVSDEIDCSEEEENTDFWGSRQEESNSGGEEMEKDVQLNSSSTGNSTKEFIADISEREDDPQEPATTVLDVATAGCQDLIEDEEVNSEKQRSSWLCCLKTCSLPPILKKSEHQSQGKRCSEDGSMDIIEMHPVEFGSSLPAEETSAGSIANVRTEAVSVAETNVEDSDEESRHSKKESEDQNQPWSDEEDNVHSFYD